jgi:hypothetical protein
MILTPSSFLIARCAGDVSGAVSTSGSLSMERVIDSLTRYLAKLCARFKVAYTYMMRPVLVQAFLPSLKKFSISAFSAEN